METMLIYSGGALLALILLVVFWRRVVRALLLLAGLGAGGLLAWAFAQQATATRKVAEVATVAARGSAAGNVAVALLALFVIGAGVIGYVALRRYLTRYTTWGDYATPLQQPVSYPGVADQSSLNALVQLEVLRALREMRAPQAPAMLAVRESDDDDGNPMWW